MKGKLTRRELLRWCTILGAGSLLPTCNSPASQTPVASPTPAPSSAPVVITPTIATAAPSIPTAAPATTTPVVISSVPRNRTLICNFGDGGTYTWVGQTNPEGGLNYEQGGSLLWDPLFYYSVFASTEYPWLAESGNYNSDYTELTIKLRNGLEWSDGKPITSADIKWTIDAYKACDKTSYHTQISEFVTSVDTPDDLTAVLKLNGPQPRFKFEVLSFKFGTGICPLPQHVFEANHVDIVKINEFPGGESMAHSGMFNVTMAPEQMIYDIRPDWWGFKTGFKKQPDVQRVIFLPVTDMTDTAQRIVSNEVDATLDMRNVTIRSVVNQNPKIITHTGTKEPLGYTDWWPNSLWMNTLLAPYSDPDVRWAINYAINRDAIDTEVYLGAKVASIFPYPVYPELKKYLDQAQPIADELGVRTFSLDKSAERMMKAGFAKDSDGLWVKDGKHVDATINGVENIHADILPTLVRMLRQGGFDASINFGNDAGQNMVDGKAGLYMYGHGASVIDPYATLELYHSRFSAPIGAPVSGNHYSRYTNAVFDQIVDQMRAIAPGDPKLNDLFLQAIRIYWTDMIDVPIIQWLHRIPMNTTYWTNWPTEANPYVNGAFWHWTFPLIVLNLKAVQ